MALLAAFAAGEIMAANTLTNYTTGDVLVCFRNGGSYDLVVDAGPVSTLVSASPNQIISIGQYSTAQLNAAFGSANGVDWSAFTWESDNTLFATQARASLNTQTTPFLRKSSTLLQGHGVQRMATIPTGAAVNNIAYNGLNTATAVIEPDSSSGFSYRLVRQATQGCLLLGAYGGQFQ